MERGKLLDTSLEQLFILLGWATVSYVLTASFPVSIRRELKKRVNGCCEICKSEGVDRRAVVQTHHICHKAVAKEFGVPIYLYQHPANAQAVCDVHHVKIHRDEKNLTEEEKKMMVIFLAQRVIDFYCHQAPSAYYIEIIRELYGVNSKQVMVEAKKWSTRKKLERRLAKPPTNGHY